MKIANGLSSMLKKKKCILFKRYFKVLNYWMDFTIIFILTFAVVDIVNSIIINKNI